MLVWVKYTTKPWSVDIATCWLWRLNHQAKPNWTSKYSNSCGAHPKEAFCSLCQAQGNAHWVVCKSFVYFGLLQQDIVLEFRVARVMLILGMTWSRAVNAWELLASDASSIVRTTQRHKHNVAPYGSRQEWPRIIEKFYVQSIHSDFMHSCILLVCRN